MDRVRIGPVKGLRIAVAAFVISIVLFIGGLLSTGYLLTIRSGDNARFAQELRDGLVRNCEKNGNPLREAVQSQLRQQIKQRETFDYGKLFPDVPPVQLHMLLEEQNRFDRARLNDIAPLPCNKVFPKP